MGFHRGGWGCPGERARGAFGRALIPLWTDKLVAGDLELVCLEDLKI